MSADQNAGKAAAIPEAVYRILDLARWAPSGDNTQVWRFEVVSSDHVVVHCFDTRDDCVYDFAGRPSQISYGALLETMAIAASAQGLRTDVARRSGSSDERPAFDVRFVADPAIQPSPLLGSIQTRSVQRRPMSTRALRAQEKQALEAALGDGYEVRWIEGFNGKLRAARLMYSNARLRLTMPEAYEVHRRIIHWNTRHSPDRVPDQALGVDAATLRLMKWAMTSWGRLSTMNRLMGTWAPRLQMDLVPGLACAAHFVIVARQVPATVEDHVAAGRAVQRFWLTLTQLGLAMQPEMTPLIFASYLQHGVPFSSVDKLHGAARQLQGRLQGLIGNGPGQPVFMGRLGAGPAAQARSLRRPVEELMKQPD
jgi:nitroreductase